MSQQQSFRKSEKPTNAILGDGIYALGVLTGVLIIILLYIGFEILSSLPSREQIIDFLPSVIAFLVALVSVLIALRALIEQKLMRQAGVDPVLVAHLAIDPIYPLLLSLNISNVGAGAAVNVKAQQDGNIPAGRSDFLDRLRASDFFNDKLPLAVILQNQSVPHLMGKGPELLGKEDPMDPFSISLTYDDIEGKNHSSSHQINVLELANVHPIESADMKIFYELEKIRKLLENRQK